MFVRRRTYDSVIHASVLLQIKVARMEEYIKLSDERKEELKEQLIKAEKAVERQEKRADNAVDAMLAKGAGVHPITPPDMSQMDYMKMVMGEADNIHEEDENEVAKIVRRMEEGDDTVFDLAGDDR